MEMQEYIEDLCFEYLLEATTVDIAAGMFVLLCIAIGIYRYFGGRRRKSEEIGEFHVELVNKSNGLAAYVSLDISWFTINGIKIYELPDGNLRCELPPSCNPQQEPNRSDPVILCWYQPLKRITKGALAAYQKEIGSS